MPARRRDHRDLTAAIGRLRTELRNQQREIQRLRMENEVLREAAEPLIHHAPARERFAFVHRLHARFGIRRLCRILVTDHSNYHAWVRAHIRRREHGIDEQELLAWIVEIHTAYPAYGAERVTRELKRQDVQVGQGLGIVRGRLVGPVSGVSPGPDYETDTAIEDHVGSRSHMTSEEDRACRCIFPHTAVS